MAEETPKHEAIIFPDESTIVVNGREGKVKKINRAVVKQLNELEKAAKSGGERTDMIELVYDQIGKLTDFPQEFLDELDMKTATQLLKEIMTRATELPDSKKPSGKA